MEYLVKANEFEGPIHVLLGLIQDRKMHVSEISLATVAEDFLKFLANNAFEAKDPNAPRPIRPLSLGKGDVRKIRVAVEDGLGPNQTVVLKLFDGVRRVSSNSRNHKDWRI